MFAGQIAAVLPPPWTDAVRRRGREHNAKFIRGAKKTRRKNTDAMGDDATARIREFHFWKPARRRVDAVWEMRTDARRESISRTHAQLSFINLVIYISTAMWHKEENILFIFNNVCLFPFIVLFNCDAIFADAKTRKKFASAQLWIFGWKETN